MPSDWMPKTFNDWPQQAVQVADPAAVQKLYEQGYAGALFNEAAYADWRDAQENPDGEQVAHAYGLADTGAGKLVVPFVWVLDLYPGAWPGAAQQRGDCVSHGCKNALLVTMCCDVKGGSVDQKTGQLEEAPEVPAEGVSQGVLSSEAIYWNRGYNGDGWYCAAAASVATRKVGLMPRKSYPDLGIDLTRYSGSLAGKYGAKSPPAEILAVGGKYLAHSSTELGGFENRRDMAFNGYGIIDCGSEGYGSTRDENGVSKRSGSWAHSMSIIGADDRDIAKQKYGEPLILIMNSWGKWNSGPRDIMASSDLVPAHLRQAWIAKGIVNGSTGNIMIPEGAFWVRWSQCKGREAIAFSGVAGFPARTFVWET